MSRVTLEQKVNDGIDNPASLPLQVGDGFSSDEFQLFGTLPEAGVSDSDCLNNGLNCQLIVVCQPCCDVFKECGSHGVKLRRLRICIASSSSAAWRSSSE